MLHMVVRCYIIKRDLISINVRFLDQPLKKAMHPLKIDEILASESFTRWLLRVRKHEGASEPEAMFNIPTTSECKNF